tara:strand:+ start:15342 stop:15851 length:510 start_codon:yes stop_codon:yes gene_type:complete
MSKKTTNKIVGINTEAASNYKMVFGIVIEINGTEVPISTDDISNWKKNGFDFKLPQPIHMGSFDDLFKWLKDNFNVEIPDIGSLPSPLNEMIAAITSLSFSVEQLAFFIPGTESKKQERTFTLRVAGSWADAKPIIPGLEVLKLKGGVFGVTNMDNSQAADKGVNISQL